MGFKKNIKGGAELNDNGKLFLRILDIFDSKHDFEKPDKSLKNIDDFLDEFLDKNSKNINMLFGELPKSDINIIYKFETLLYKQKTEDELLLYGIDNLLGYDDSNYTELIDFMFDIDQFEIEKIKRITTTGISTYRRNIKNKGTKTLISLTNAVILELSNNTLFSKSFNLQYLCIKELINSLLINITNSNNTVIEKCIDVFNLSDEEKSIKKILSDYYNNKYMDEFKNNLDRIRNVLTIYIKKIFNYVEKIFNEDIDKKLRISFDDYKDKNKKIDRTSQSTMKDIKKTINRDKDLKTINMIMNEYNKDYKMFIKKIEDVSKLFSE